MKEIFYIFLEIDGVLWDWGFIESQRSKDAREMSDNTNSFKPESMDALNFLIKTLSNNYNINLILSSCWQTINMAEVVNVLYENGLKDISKIEATRVTSHKIRGIEIKEYLNDKPNNQNYVIIDDETSDIKAFVNNKRIIKTNMLASALNLNQVKEFLTSLKENTQEEVKEETEEIEQEIVEM